MQEKKINGVGFESFEEALEAGLYKALKLIPKNE